MKCTHDEPQYLSASLFFPRLWSATERWANVAVFPWSIQAKSIWKAFSFIPGYWILSPWISSSLAFGIFAPKTSRKRQFLEISFPRLLLMAVHDCCNLLGPSLSFWVRDQLFSNKTGKMFMNQLNLTISKAIKTKLLFTISIQYQADQH